MTEIMKINRLDAHDRLQSLKTQSNYISQGCEDCIRNRPEEFGKLPFYIFAHARTHENGADKRLLWTPRLTKPKAQTNSMLFKYYPIQDLIKIIWMIPDRALWKQFKKGNLTEHKIIIECIHDFHVNRGKLEAKENDDLSDESVNNIYNNIARNQSTRNLMDKLWLMPKNEEVSSF